MRCFTLGVAAFIGLCFGCSSFSAPVDSDVFRDIFFENLANPGLSSKQRAFLVYEATENIQSSKLPSDVVTAFSSEAPLKKLDALFNAEKPVNLYEAALEKGAPSNGNYRQALATTPITLVVVPGIFGEFIDTRAFEEVFENTNSQYALQWNELATGTDDSWDNTQLKIIKRPMKELVAAASIDDKQGNTLVRAVIFQTPRMSFESLGQLEEVAPKFIRRLEKFFSAMGTPQNIVLVGYSRGTSLALQMLSRVEKENRDDAKDGKDLRHSWLSKVRGVVSLGGTTWGSGLADDLDNPNSASAKQMKDARELAAALKTGPLALAGNTILWTAFLAKQAKQKLKEGITKDNLKLPDVKVDLDFRSGTKTVLRFYKEFGLDHPNDVDNNVKKFQEFVNQVYKASRQLKTSERIAWWKTHTVPTDGIRYYSVGATMADPKQVDASIALNTLSYAPTSLDYSMLIGNYRDFVKVAASQLNDSQVALHRIQFWSELNVALNPKQKPLQTTFLGVLGTHHWGLALRTVNGGPKDPFPRKALFQSIATAVAVDLENSKK